MDIVDRNLRKTRVGMVISDKMDKTIVVQVERRKRHPLYGRIIRVELSLRPMTRTMPHPSGTGSG